MSSGLVRNVVVNPAHEPATHWINKCEVFIGKYLMSSSVHV